jgi:MEDS: MEthanogen/methylotroph, DcmR Sensory domain
MVNIPYITRCGLPGIEHVPFGMHACHFYRNRNELVAAMVPYFIAGLRENERCLWITAPHDLGCLVGYRTLIDSLPVAAPISDN